nr:hypothetical protein [Tanacetum cinerariifolium]
MPSEYRQDYKKIRAYALEIYNDHNMSDTLRDIYRILESRFVHEGRTIDPSFYNDLSDDSVAKFTAIGPRSMSIRRIQGIEYNVLGFLGVGTMFDISNTTYWSSGYNVLNSDGNDKVIMWYQEPRFGLEFRLVDSSSEDIYAAVDSFETAQEIWLRVQQMKKGSDIGIQEKKAKLFNEWGRFTSNEGQNGVDMLLLFIRTRTCTQLITLNLPHQDQSSFNQNYLQQPIPNPEDITDPTTAMNMALTLMAKAFKLNYSTPTNNNQRISSNLRNMQITQPARAEGNAAAQNGNQIRCYNCRGIGHYARNCTVKPWRRDDAYLQTQLLIAQKEEAGIQLQAEEYDLMAATADLDEIKEVNAICILMDNLQQASTSASINLGYSD